MIIPSGCDAILISMHAHSQSIFMKGGQRARAEEINACPTTFAKDMFFFVQLGFWDEISHRRDCRGRRNFFPRVAKHLVSHEVRLVSRYEPTFCRRPTPLHFILMSRVSQLPSHFCEDRTICSTARLMVRTRSVTGK